MDDLPTFDDSPLRPLVDQVSDGIAVAAPNPWRLLYVSSTLADWFGKAADELRGSPLETIFSADARAQALQLADLVYEGASPKAEMTADLEVDRPGFGPVDVRLCRIVADDRTFVGIVVRRARMHAVPPSAERLDPLTGLPDRQFLLLRLAAMLRGQRSADQKFAVLFVDLDNFKQVNDQHGHLIGDRVLREVARRLTGCVRDGDYVVRFGGDEFVVLLEGVRGRRGIDPVISRIHTALEKPIALPEGECSLSLSIGMAEPSPDHHTPEDLLRDADRAMYAAKRAGN